MKQIVILVALLLMAGGLFSQEVFKLGTVKGEHVTYQVREQKNFPLCWLVRNTQNPDTVFKAIPQKSIYTAQEMDSSLQIAEIIHDHLSSEELQALKDAVEIFSVILRVDCDSRKLQQVSGFLFMNRYAANLRKTSAERPRTEILETYDGFWLNFDPDRLYEIEKDIVKRVVLPEKLHDFFLANDFDIAVSSQDVCDIARVREERQKAIEDWKKEGTRSEIVVSGFRDI